MAEKLDPEELRKISPRWRREVLRVEFGLFLRFDTAILAHFCPRESRRAIWNGASRGSRTGATHGARAKSRAGSALYLYN